MHEHLPELLKDQYWDKIDTDIPYTAASREHYKAAPLGSAEQEMLVQSLRCLSLISILQRDNPFRCGGSYCTLKTIFNGFGNDMKNSRDAFDTILVPCRDRSRNSVWGGWVGDVPDAPSTDQPLCGSDVSFSNVAGDFFLL